LAQGIGATLVIGMTATLILGPFIGIVLAGGTFYASTREDKYGSTVRLCGDSFCNLFDKSVDTCKKCNVDDIVPPERRQKLTETISATAEQVIRVCQDMDDKYGVTTRTSKFLGLKPHQSDILPTVAPYEYSSQNTANVEKIFHDDIAEEKV